MQQFILSTQKHQGTKDASGLTQQRCLIYMHWYFMG